MSEAGYHIHYHKRVDRTLNELTDARADELRELIREISRIRQPTSHPKVKQLTGYNGLFRIRDGDHRIICELDTPDLLVWLVGERNRVYEDLKTIGDQF